MAKQRKPCNRRAQIDRARRALVRTNHAAVANVEPGDIQVMVNWKTCKQICSRPVADALCDIAHRWTVYIAVFCQELSGSQYSKATQKIVLLCAQSKAPHQIVWQALSNYEVEVAA